MCGIVGVVNLNGIHKDQVDLFNQMLITDSVRGKDGVGVFAVNKKQASKVIKYGGEPFHVLFNKEYKEQYVEKCNQLVAMVGHNRWATFGAVNNKNAHPFREGNITLVHNGSARNTDRIKRAGVEVDSHMICHAINEKGMDAFKDINASFALVWHNKADSTLNIVRNMERPLHYAIVFNSLYFASEKKMLEWILDRNGIKNADVVEFSDRKHYQIKLDTNKFEMDIVGNVPYFTHPVGYYNNNHYNNVIPAGDRYPNWANRGTKSRSIPIIGEEYLAIPERDIWYKGEHSGLWFLTFKSPLFKDYVSFRAQMTDDEFKHFKDHENFVVRIVDRTISMISGEMIYNCRVALLHTPKDTREAIATGEMLSHGERAIATCSCCNDSLREESFSNIYIIDDEFTCASCVAIGNLTAIGGN